MISGHFEVSLDQNGQLPVISGTFQDSMLAER